jgi:glutathionylspermidine synthase
LEWFVDVKPKKWQGYFNTEAVSCNHPIAIYAQTKRFPLVWDVLENNGINMSTWRSLLPETKSAKDVAGNEDYIFKPAYGRVGEGISIREAIDIKEYEKILRDVRRHPSRFVAQKKFTSRPLEGEEGQQYHVCLGSYAIDGAHGGYYARISATPRIDSNAADIPVLIERAGE